MDDVIHLATLEPLLGLASQYFLSGANQKFRIIFLQEDPCEGVECPASQVCQLDNNRNPICRCNAICSPDFRPVCGSDGKTYINECSLRVESCKSRRSLRIIFSGECSSGANPCENLQCGPGQECDIDRYGIATCQCPPNCEPVMRPVCGDDGKTYYNECEMRRSGCEVQRLLTAAYRGACGAIGTCFEHECENGALCFMRNRKPYCACVDCAEDFDPVCGTDGISYINECKLFREACEQMKKIAVAYQGLCSGCEHKHCEYYAACESDSEGVGRCVCPKNCVKVDSVICGTDGITYKNECEMRVAACEKEQYIMVGSRGPCDLCQNVHCKHGARCENGHCICAFDCPDAYDPVCGSDGTTYRNDCEMRRGSCQKGINLATVFFGECDGALVRFREDHEVNTHILTCEMANCRYGGVCDHDPRGHVHCICTFHCSPLRDPVCGSDGRMYENECRLREEACRLQQNIQIVASENCGVISVSVCLQSPFGCCPDGRTLALGPNAAGCPSTCNCNRLGSYGETCDSISGQCECKTGVGGLRCDRCDPGYWGLHKIVADGNVGCLPCDCNMRGSARDDCEQMTGRCVCKHGILGMKCDICPEGMVLGQDGCMDESLAESISGTCKDLHCKYGAICRESGSRAQCFCEIPCKPITVPSPVCGTDGNTYVTSCQMSVFSCRYQKPIHVKQQGPCKPGGIIIGAEDVSPTAGPVRRSTVQKTTFDQFESKSTRDVSHSEQFFLSTGPTTSKPPIDDTPVDIPAFSGVSFLELPKLQAYTRLSLELEFKTFGGNGIILYNGQTPSGSGDFVSLSVRDGFVEFRYNLGSGPVILRSPHRLQKGKFHRLVAKRYLRDGVLTLDGQEDVAGHSEGTLKSLDLTENMFLGYVPTENKGIFDNIGINSGLIGCIRRLRVGQHDVNLTYPISKDILRGQSIRECKGKPCNSVPCRNGGTCKQTDVDSFQCFCAEGFSGDMCQKSEDPCASFPCANGATCVTLPNHEFSCTCDKGYSGRFCEHKPSKPVVIEDVYIPDLDGAAFLELPTLPNVGQEFVIELWFLSRSKDGMLLYNGQESLGRGDFVSLNLVDRYIQFLYDLGSGVANITSASPINIDQWHVVRATRILRRGSLQLDDGPVATGESKEPLSELNLDLPLYLGGYRHLSTINPESGITSRFNGAFQRLVLNGEVVDDLRKVAKSSQDVGHFYGQPCGPNPCHNGGMCLPQLNNFHCKCPVAYTGLWCEKYIENVSVDEPIMFDGKTFLKFPNKLFTRLFTDGHNRVEVTFRTDSTDGLILWSHEDVSTIGDFMALAVEDGFLVVSFNSAGNREPLLIKHNIRINDGDWHRAVIDRNNRHGMLQVDDNTPAVVTSTPETKYLNTDGVLWIGGCSNLPAGLNNAYYKGFIGCIHSVIVDGEALKIATHGTGQSCPIT
ncbi:agrin-like isoform X2 [Parasteatoda tepidariorum]|uniref:agrin-like isoform X2 n=1 Tax=Parasteatoda tepidariorum TaxID=114398 RepID=UPI00077FDB0C